MTELASITDDARLDFTRALRVRLSDHSARALAAKAHWGRTVVADITSGRKLPSERQLDDLFKAIGADSTEREAWRLRLVSVTSPSSAVIADERPAEVQPERPRTRLGGRWWWAGACVVLVGALVAWVLPWRAGGTAPIVPSEPTSPAAAPTTPSAKGGAVASIEEPVDGASLGSHSGVRLRGAAPEDPSSTYWLIDQDPDGTYTVDLAVDVQPDGSWSALDAPVGEPSEIPSRLWILLIRADDRCAAVLRREADAEDSTFKMLPTGCLIEDRVQVVIDRP